jgi:hypothetical protein
MPRAGFELTILVFERLKTVRALDRTAVGTGIFSKVETEFLKICNSNIMSMFVMFFISNKNIIDIEQQICLYFVDDRGSRVRFPAGLGIFLFTTASRAALGPTQPPIQRVRGALSMGVKRPGREADH